MHIWNLGLSLIRSKLHGQANKDRTGFNVDAT